MNTKMDFLQSQVNTNRNQLNQNLAFNKQPRITHNTPKNNKTKNETEMT